ncbi:CusA/CzcA family heavy metal efflux RND transporter [Flavobacterium urocaniciphilum]|uniref:Cobalt-zinc-cadmium resistance protein CzcA n=1 Tax=Flavobacterium urocaniciphilum TaxID=1299341 RepID=A0A1H9E1R8_9FLAO|nr:CusA/CzcA family heavy metal efflux RND transporter [Flavobacterium urocaniciphilum]SEQ19700.1 cobalt-zinc-cadmium resistance protein CzcA [Flavobacterium urocaniciphilum]
MLNNIIEYSVKNKLIIALFTLILIGFGIYNVQKLPIDAVPDITNNQVQVITVAPSFGATDIERLVTFPIEQVNANISGLKEIRSFSRFGLSLVTIVFEDDVDVYWARQQVAERLQQVQSQLPQGMGIPELGPISTGLGEIYQYVVRAKKGYEQKYDVSELRTIQDWIVKRQLAGVKGVAEVSSFGGKLRQVEISIQPNKLNANGITITDVFDALEKNNQNTGGAYIEKEASVLFIRSEGLIQNLEAIENTPITTKSGVPLFIKDVAEVKNGFATRYGAMCYNNEGEVSGAIVMMLKGANSSEVIENVKERIAQIQKTLPEGVVIEPFLDRTKMVNNAIGTVEKNLIEGALIVIFVLVIFLGNLRAGLLVASVIPLSMLFAIIMMNLFGVSGNLMSLGALDFGLIVDGAVIIVEAVIHQIFHRHQNEETISLSQEEVNKEVNSSAKKMMNSAVFGQIIILIVYLPIFTLQGIEGKMFKPMAQTVAFALIGAFILSLTYIPMMSAVVLKNIKHNPQSFSERMMAFLERIYLMRLIQALHNKKKIIIGTIIAFVISLVVMSQLGGEFIPSLEEGDFAVETRVLTGSNLNTSIASTQKAAGILKSRFPEVEKVVTKIGSGEVPTDPMPMEAADMMVILKDKKEWTSAETFNELSDKMSAALQEVPGITVGFQYPVQMRFNELMTGARQDVVCKIYGEDLDTLSKYANKVGKIVNSIKGAKDLYVEPIGGMPQVVIEYKRNVLAQYQLNVTDVNRVVNASFAGQSAGLLFEGERRFDVVVRVNSNEKQNLQDIQNLLIPTPSGSQVPLQVIADVKIINGPNQIQREDTKRRIVVGFNVHESDVQSLVEEMKQKVEAKIKFPTGYYITYGGSFENLNAAKDRLMIAVPISLLLIFLLLYFAFKSVKHALLIYTAIPLSTIGGILFLAFRGMPFSISAGVGFIALFGVAVLNGIVLIAEFNAQKKLGKTDITEIILIGTKKRLRPILMTAFVASLGFLPMAISNGSGAEVQRPLATVVIGGLLIATFLTLFILPILYMLFEKKSSLSIPKNGIAVLFLFMSISGIAQNKSTLNQVFEKGLANNLVVKNEKQRVIAAQVLVKSANEIPSLNLVGEYGQLNSAFNDNRIGITQNISFPFLNAKKKNWYQIQTEIAQLNYKTSENEVKRAITQNFYDLIYALEREKVLKQSDSIYNQFLNKAKMRLKLGETNHLEKEGAQLAVAKISADLKKNQELIYQLQLQMQYLIQSDEVVFPSYKDVKIEYLTSSDFVSNNVQLQVIEKEKMANEAAIKIEKAALIPEISLGYFSMTMQGMGANDVLYNSGTRFQSFQMNLGIPIFNGANKARREAFKINSSILNNQSDLQKKQLENIWQSFENKRQNDLIVLKNYEESVLPGAKLMITTANNQIYKGEINYMEWSWIMNQALESRLDYLEKVKSYNDAIIQMLYQTTN